METQNKIPKMLEFLFGEAAEAAQQAASPRLLRWCRAFDDWLAERLRSRSLDTCRQDALAWKRLLAQCRKMPWELSQADIQAYVASMQSRGYSTSTTAHVVGALASFYRWCSERRVDSKCKPGFNPAAVVARPRVRPGDRIKLLSRGEVHALLDILQRDASPLGRREYAFFLARLRLGVPLKTLQRLQWGQIEQEAGKSTRSAWVHWRPGAARIQLPGEVWQAILDYLQASGRLAGMRAGVYIFSPLAEPGKAERGAAAEDWLEERWLSSSTLRSSLKIYGRPVGIPEEKLNLNVLRNTAIRLRLDESGASVSGLDDAASLEAIQVFMDDHEEQKMIRSRLHRLPQLPPDQAPSGEQPEEQAGEEQLPPGREAHRFTSEESFIHGYYARSLPHEAVLEVLAEDIHGFEQEFMGLRTLARGLIDRMDGASPGDRVCLGAAYTMAASRIGEMVNTGKQQAEKENQDPWAEELLAMLDAFLEEQGSPPISETVRKEALQGDPEQELAAQLLREEIASVRYVLRNTFQAAIDAVKMESYLHLVDIYGKECIKLVRLLKHQPNDNDRLEAYLEKALDQAIKELMEEWGL